jgi:poly-beta-hydroxyalkanoate depolymerase
MGTALPYHLHEMNQAAMAPFNAADFSRHVWTHASNPLARTRLGRSIGVGHFGVFNGTRFRNETVPKILSFMDAAQG